MSNDPKRQSEHEDDSAEETEGQKITFQELHLQLCELWGISPKRFRNAPSPENTTPDTYTSINGLSGFPTKPADDGKDSGRKS